MKKIKCKIALYLSGGVDSSFSALITKKNFFYIETFFFKNWQSLDRKTCLFINDLIYVKNLCKTLNIKLNILDYVELYWNFVFLNFLKYLKRGLTPNPDIYCNKLVKFKVILYYIIFFLEFDFLLTGHFSGIKKLKRNVLFLKNKDECKSQIYFFFNIKKQIRKNLIFPLFNHIKKQIKNRLKSVNFLNFNKKSSTGICFIGEKKFKFFISKYIKEKKGMVLDDKNIALSHHQGIFFYTIGEKFFIKEKPNDNFYIIDKNYKKNIIYVTKSVSKLFINKILIKNINLKKKYDKIFLYAKVRSTGKLTKVLIKYNKYKQAHVVFFKFCQKSITPGQFIVFYNEKTCEFGAEIKKVCYLN